jgi:hypothetical protein
MRVRPRLAAAIVGLLMKGSDNSSINDPNHDPVALTEPINVLLRKHQVSVRGWKYHDLLCEFYTWVERFNSEFKLNIPMPVIAIGLLKERNLAEFRFGRNMLGIKHEIIIGRHHIESDEYWNQIGSVLHECLHLHESLYGRPARGGNHSREFRDKAASLGLLVDERGGTKYASENSPFFNVLAAHGVEVPSWCHVDEPQSDDRVRQTGPLALKMLITRYAMRVKAAATRLRTKCLTRGASLVKRVRRADNQI